MCVTPGKKKGFTLIELWFVIAVIAPAVILPLSPASGEPTFIGGDRQAFPLNGHQSLGQTFTVNRPFNILWLVAPSWNDNEGGFTLSLWDSAQKKKLWGHRTFNDIVDNARLVLYLREPAPAGNYYWEIHDRTGSTRIGLYGYVGSQYAGGKACFDGVPDERIDFLSGWEYSPFVTVGRRLSLRSRRQGTAPTRRGDRLPQWIWYPEADIPDNCQRFFRYDFDLDAPPVTATLLMTADDAYTLWVNGKQVGEDGDWKTVETYDLHAQLRGGKNLLAVRVFNAIAPAGLIARLTVRTESGREYHIITDERWLANDTEQKGWTDPECDDSGWEHGVSVGDAISDPWYAHGNIRKLSAGVDFIAALQRLKGEPPCRAGVKSYKGAPRLFLNGKVVFPLLFCSGVDEVEFSRDFADIGVHLFQVRYDLSQVWVRPSQFDFSALDLHLARMLHSDPQACFLVLIQLEPPGWWKDAHPAELIRYADGAWFTGDMWGGAKHASFASSIWREEATQALRALIRHFEASPLRSRIFGYHLANGIYGEWHYFGARHLPDVSEPMTEAFRKWAKQRYGTVPSLQAAWGVRFDDFERIVCPGMEDRVHMDFGLFRDPGKSRYVSDYYRFFHEHNADVLLHFARVVKEETKGRVLCGALNGYLLENLWIQEGGHLAALKVLTSPDIDFIACPYDYQGPVTDGAGNDFGAARGVGGDAGYRVLAASARLHDKLYFAEIDTATCLELNPSLQGYGGEGTETLEGSLKALRRDLAQMIGEGVASWLLELGSGWWAHDRLMAEIRNMKRLGESCLHQDASSVAEVGAVFDTDSFFFTSHWKDPEAGEFDLFDYYFLDTQARALHRLAAPVDFLYHEDLSNPNLRDYKLYLVVNCFYLTDQEAAALRRKACRNGAVVVWVYAPGFVHSRGLSVDRMSQLTGFRLHLWSQPGLMQIEMGAALPSNLGGPQESKAVGHSGKGWNPAEPSFGLPGEHFPRFIVADPSAQALGNWKGTDKPAMAIKRFKDWTSVYVGTGPLPVGMLRNLANLAGVRLYSDAPDILYANRSFAAIVANGRGKRKLSLPFAMTDLLTGRKGVKDVTLEMDKGEVRLFRTESPHQQ